MGLLHELCASKCLERFLHPYDVVCFTHTGAEYADCEGDSPSSALALLGWCPRTIARNSGGVAVFVRKHKRRLFRVELCRPEMGMIWFSYGERGATRAYTLCCYLPPGNSTYYSHHTCPDASEHWAQLMMDINSFQQQGPVFITGDLNARVGDLNEWALLDPHVLRHSNLPGLLGPRQSQDRTVNSAGRQLINMCQQAELVMLNGRAAGDTRGAWTYCVPSLRSEDGGRGRSVIDWWISPMQSFVNFGDHMQMHVIENPPFRPDGGLFDHRPVCCTVVWAAERDVAPIADEEPHVSLHWREDFRAMYTDILQTDGEVLRFQSALHNHDVSAEASCSLIHNMVYRAADVLHDRVGGVYRYGTHGNAGSNHRPRAWVSEEVRELQSEVDRMREVHGRDETVLRDAIHRLKKLRNRDRKQYIRNKAEKIRTDMLHNPQQFWRRYKGRRSSRSRFTVADWTRHFKSALQVEGNGWEGEEHVSAHCAQFPGLFGTASPSDMSAAAWLNDPVTEAEVEAALAAMNLGKAAGPDGMPVEFVRQVYWETRTRGEDGRPRINRRYLLAGHLAVTFSRMIEEGFFPTDWAAGIVSPVPKGKGDPNSMQSYRPITVGSALGKIFSQVLLARMDRWAEVGGWRAETQFGFRSGMGTSEATFLLRHVLDMDREARKPTCAAFVDFKQAYDSVDRDLLWRCLGKMGIHGKCLSILQQMYAHGNLCIKTQDGIGEAFTADLGVKQGDPLSPLLFGLYIDRVCCFIRTRVPTAGVIAGGIRADCILYADDLVLLAHDRERLQHLLNALAEFCTATKLKVNIEKTETVFFNKQWLEGAHRAVKFEGRQIKMSTSFVYLGVVFHAKGSKDSAKQAFRRRLDKARGALFSMMGTCHGLKIFDVRVLNKLFDTLCVPCLTYGVEQWGPDVLLGNRHGVLDCGDIEGLHATFMRMTLWVKKSTPHHCMRREMQRQPLGRDCIIRCASVWNKMANGNEESLVHKCWLENKSLGEGSWCQKMCELRARVMGETWRVPDNDTWNVYDCKCALDTFYNDSVDLSCRSCMEATGEPYEGVSRVRACPDDVRHGFKVFKHKVWFHVDSDVPVMSHLPEAGNIRTLAQFRCGAHRLACEADRDGAPRSRRLCRHCDEGVIEDELHVLLCRAWQQYRELFPTFFGGAEFQALVQAVQVGHNVDECFKKLVNPSEPRMTDMLVGYLKKVFLDRNVVGL